MNPHIPSDPTLGVGVSMNSWMFREQLQKSKPIGLKSSLYHLKTLEMQMFKMGLHYLFEYLKHKSWPKEGLRIKLPIWLLTIKSQESPQFFYINVACHIPLESSWWKLQLFFKPHLNQKSAHKVMRLQSCRSPNFGNFVTPTWESWDKMTFRSYGHAQIIL